MAQAPETTVDIMWYLSHIGVPAAVGLLIGIFVRSIIRTVVVVAVIGVIAIIVLAKMGIATVDAEQAEKARGLLPTLADLAAGAWHTLKASPAALIGVILGIVLRESWRRRRPRD